MARKSDVVPFTETHPDLVSDKKNKFGSDYYELKIYKLLNNFSIYRNPNDLGSSRFIDNLLPCDFLDELYKDAMEQNTDNGILITPWLDIYEARHIANRISYPFLKRTESKADSITMLENTWVSLTPIYTGNINGTGHATLLVNIFDPETKELLVRISAQSEHRFRQHPNS